MDKLGYHRYNHKKKNQTDTYPRNEEYINSLPINKRVEKTQEKSLKDLVYFSPGLCCKKHCFKMGLARVDQDRTDSGLELLKLKKKLI